MQITESIKGVDHALFYESDGGTRNGMWFILYKQSHHTKEDIIAAKNYIKNQQDSLGIKVKVMTQDIWRKATRECNKMMSFLNQVKCINNNCANVIYVNENQLQLIQYGMMIMARKL